MTFVRAAWSGEADVRTIDIHEAKRHLSGRVDEAARGEPFVITRAGKPLVMVIALDAPTAPRRVGFLAAQIAVPDDFDRICEAEIEALSEGRR